MTRTCSNVRPYVLELRQIPVQKYSEQPDGLTPGWLALEIGARARWQARADFTWGVWVDLWHTERDWLKVKATIELLHPGYLVVCPEQQDGRRWEDA